MRPSRAINRLLERAGRRSSSTPSAPSRAARTRWARCASSSRPAGARSPARPSRPTSPRRRPRHTCGHARMPRLAIEPDQDKELIEVSMTEPRPIPIVACLAGDGIGPEVMAEAGRVIDAVSALIRRRACARCTCRSAATRSTSTGDPFPAHVRAAVKASDAVLLGAVGGPRWERSPRRPEQGLLELRKELDTYANLRPVRHGDIDLIVVRELTGGLYFGEKVLDRRQRLRHVQLHARADRAGRALGVPARPAPRGPRRLGRQGQRARHVQAVAAGRDRAARRRVRRSSSSRTSSSTRSR